MQIFKLDANSGTSAEPILEETEQKSQEESYTDRIVRMAEETKVNKAEYRSLAHVCPTSVMVERLFSDAKHIMTDDRRHMDPSTLDMLLFLKNNKDLWNAQTIDEILNKEASAAAPATIGNKRPHDDDDEEGGSECDD